MSARWFRDRYTDAIWEDETLTAVEKAVAETYARHAKDSSGQKTAGADRAWLTYERLMAMAGIRRRANVSDATKTLVKEGWLVPHVEIPRKPTVYRLAIPILPSSTIGTSETSETSSDGGTRLVPKPAPTSSAESGSPQFTSSDGGTPPLKELPLERSPSSVTPRAGLEELRARLDLASDDEGIWILHKIRSNATGPIRKSMGVYLAGVEHAHLIEYQTAYRELPAPLPDHCGSCDSDRLVDWPNGRHGPCPRCHRHRESVRADYEAAFTAATTPPARPRPAAVPPWRKKPNNACGRFNCDGTNVTLGKNLVPCGICAESKQADAVVPDLP